jgi:hypothetical protein
MAMTRIQTTGLVVAVGLAVAALACVETKHESPASPTEVAKVLATGSWTSAATAAPTGLNPGSCGNLEWKIATMTSTSASGTFKATCGGGLTLEGKAEGTLSGLTANLKADGTVTGTGINCPFALTGTAVPEGLDAVRITYNGTTCLGPVSGSEVLKKR